MQTIVNKYQCRGLPLIIFDCFTFGISVSSVESLLSWVRTSALPTILFFPFAWECSGTAKHSFSFSKSSSKSRIFSLIWGGMKIPAQIFCSSCDVKTFLRSPSSFLSSPFSSIRPSMVFFSEVMSSSFSEVMFSTSSSWPETSNSNFCSSSFASTFFRASWRFAFKLSFSSWSCLRADSYARKNNFGGSDS